MKRFFILISWVFVIVCAADAGATALPQKKPVFEVSKKASAPPQKEDSLRKAHALPEKKPSRPAVSAAVADTDLLPLTDTEQKLPLPDYPAGARVTLGKDKKYTVDEEDTMIDIARHFGLGYVEIRGANPDVDPWAPPPGSDVDIPLFTLLPRARQEGILVNLGKMRLYYFKDKGKPPLSFAIGIGREGLQTPVGETTVVRKMAQPSWFPTERMRKEKPWLPGAVPPGASNPLGERALYLGWPTFLIHGSNKPWGIGRRVSSGCMRMYPEDIRELFSITPVGTPVTVVDQPVLIAWHDDRLYLEVNPTQTQSVEIEVDGRPSKIIPLSDEYKKEIQRIAGDGAAIDWRIAAAAFEQRAGRPVVIARRGEAVADLPAPVPAAQSARIQERANRGFNR
jgi:L,D-transpeptidase ErfK/SrfK